jgi:hypothetical protein
MKFFGKLVAAFVNIVCSPVQLLVRRTQIRIRLQLRQ